MLFLRLVCLWQRETRAAENACSPLTIFPDKTLALCGNCPWICEDVVFIHYGLLYLYSIEPSIPICGQSFFYGFIVPLNIAKVIRRRRLKNRYLWLFEAGYIP